MDVNKSFRLNEKVILPQQRLPRTFSTCGDQSSKRAIKSTIDQGASILFNKNKRVIRGAKGPVF
jgi:hypothetical protein